MHSTREDAVRNAWGMMDRVESIKDERIALARSLTARSVRAAAGRCLIEGATLIRQVVAAGANLEYALAPRTRTPQRRVRSWSAWA